MKPITAENVAIICPTKNQPDKVLRLVESIVQLDAKPHQVIIADGGHNLKPILTVFNEQINLICLYCPEVGKSYKEITRTNILKKNIQLVLHLDDDITLDQGSLREMIMFWNEESKNRAPTSRRII